MSQLSFPKQDIFTYFHRFLSQYSWSVRCWFQVQSVRLVIFNPMIVFRYSYRRLNGSESEQRLWYSTTSGAQIELGHHTATPKIWRNEERESQIKSSSRALSLEAQRLTFWMSLHLQLCIEIFYAFFNWIVTYLIISCWKSNDYVVLSSNIDY